MNVEKVRQGVLEWCSENCDFELPWRRARSPWLVLLAELLLRKTTTKQVAKVYEKAVEELSGPSAVASKGVRELEELLKPLGMEHKRARLFKRLAEYLLQKHGGSVPCSEDELLEIPGVGKYAASVVLLVACNEPRPLLDTNTSRVLSRLAGLRHVGQDPYKDPVLLGLAWKLTPRNPEEARLFWLGLLDLGRKVCKKRKPLCSECPLSSLCLARRQDRA